LIRLDDCQLLDIADVEFRLLMVKLICRKIALGMKSGIGVCLFIARRYGFRFKLCAKHIKRSNSATELKQNRRSGDWIPRAKSMRNRISKPRCRQYYWSGKPFIS